MEKIRKILVQLCHVLWEWLQSWSWQLFPATHCRLLFGYSMMELKPNSVLELFAFRILSAFFFFFWRWILEQRMNQVLCHWSVSQSCPKPLAIWFLCFGTWLTHLLSIMNNYCNPLKTHIARLWFFVGFFDLVI